MGYIFKFRLIIFHQYFQLRNLLNIIALIHNKPAFRVRQIETAVQDNSPRVGIAVKDSRKYFMLRHIPKDHVSFLYRQIISFYRIKFNNLSPIPGDHIWITACLIFCLDKQVLTFQISNHNRLFIRSGKTSLLICLIQCAIKNNRLYKTLISADYKIIIVKIVTPFTHLLPAGQC